MRGLDYLKEWLKTILYMNVFLLIFDSLVQTTKYEKYFRFFSGFLMMLCLVKPLVDLSGAAGYMDAAFIQNQLKNELHLIGKSEELKGMRGEIQKIYDQAVENQIIDLASSCEIAVTEVKIQWQRDSDQMEKLELEGKVSEGDDSSPKMHSLREMLMQYYHLDYENIIIDIKE